MGLTTIRSPSGVSIKVNSDYSDRFQGFVNDLEGAGYSLKQGTTGGYSVRNIAGTNTPSQHSFGNAVDINWQDNPRLGGPFKSDLPADVGDMAAKNGLKWGGVWRNPDPMHFEVDKNWDGSDAATNKLKNYNTRPGFSKDANGEYGKKGNQKGDDSKASDHDKRSKENSPPGKGNQNDIKGSTGSYQKTQTQTIASRMPTHEPWLGHPRSKEGPRQAVKGGGGGGGGGGGSGSNSGGNTPGQKGGGGTSSNPSGNNETPAGKNGETSPNYSAGGVKYGKDISGLGVQNLGSLAPNDQVKGFIFHHTGGRGTPEAIQGVLNGGRGMKLGVQFIMDRDGTVYKSLPDGSKGAHMTPGYGEGAGLSNSNTIGVEMIAKNNNDLTPAQIESAQRLFAEQKEKYPNLEAYGHGEVNKGRKEADEGMGAVNAIRKKQREEGKKKPKSGDPGMNKQQANGSPAPAAPASTPANDGGSSAKPAADAKATPSS